MRLTDIAKHARVSPATVSRAINQPTLVAPDSLARIQAVMASHGYVPAPAGRRRGPKAQRARLHRIGVWFVGARSHNPNLNWFQDQLLHVQSSHQRYRVDLNVLISGDPDEMPRALERDQIDGVIIQGMQPSPALLARLGNLPHVWFMTRRSLDFPGDYVEPDNEENGRLAARYLAERGHRSVAVVALDPDYSATVQRVRAFEAEARAAGLTLHRIFGQPNPGVSYLHIAPYNQEIATLARHVTAAEPRPTGLYLPVDHFAGACFRALRGVGLVPGEDVDVILGNYNPMIHHNLDHSPAAIDVNLPTLVRKVVDHLVWRIENPGSTGRIGIRVSPTLRPAGP